MPFPIVILALHVVLRALSFKNSHREREREKKREKKRKRREREERGKERGGGGGREERIKRGGEGRKG